MKLYLSFIVFVVNLLCTVCMYAQCDLTNVFRKFSIRHILIAFIWKNMSNTSKLNGLFDRFVSGFFFFSVGV